MKNYLTKLKNKLLNFFDRLFSLLTTHFRPLLKQTCQIKKGMRK